jgi:hypothetical protein
MENGNIGEFQGGSFRRLGGEGWGMMPGVRVASSHTCTYDYARVQDSGVTWRALNMRQAGTLGTSERSRSSVGLLEQRFCCGTADAIGVTSAATTVGMRIVSRC